MNERERLAGLSVRYGGSWSRIHKALQADEACSIPVRENYITIYDETYPPQLRSLQQPPWVLFYEGDISLLQLPMMTVIGSRRMTGYGAKMTETAVSILRRQFVIVSGLAMGVDACAHKCAMAGGHTIGVIGSGLKTRYPAGNTLLYEQMGRTDLILSEFPYDVPVARQNFPWRNRILAALGQGTVVTQAAEKSGTLITVNEALELDRDVYCFPWPFNDPAGAGCLRLINEGAQLLPDPDSIRAIVPRLRF